MASPLLDTLSEGASLVRANWYLALGLYLISRIAYNAFFHPLAKHPGPWLARVSDAWKAGAVKRGTYTDELAELHRKHGDIVRIGPNEVSIISPDDIRDLYGHKSDYLKGPFYDAWALGGQNHFSKRDPVDHANGKRAVAGAYAINHLQSLERFCDEQTEVLFGIFDKAVASDQPADVAQYVEWYTYDTVASMSFAGNYGFLENQADPLGILQIMAQAVHGGTVLAVMHSIGWILPTRLMGWITDTFQGERGPNYFPRTAAKFLKKRLEMRERNRAEYEDTKDMLYRFMESRNPATGQPLGFDQLLTEAHGIVIAGSDTTRISMVTFLRHVYGRPEILAKLRAEIDRALEKGDFKMPPTYAQAAKLEYLQATMKEAMRIWPAVGMTLQRVVPAGGRVIAGSYFPAGSLVGMSPFNIHHDRRAYGTDASQFRPERWLEGDRNELEKYNLTFGQGSRACIGKNLSLLEMSKLLPAIVHRYDLSWDETKGEPYKTTQYWFVPQKDFFCQIQHRAG